MLNEYVIIRSHDSGVHAGILAEKEGSEVLLKDSRRLWYWMNTKDEAGEHYHFLSGVALHGVDPVKSKVGEVLPRIKVLGVCEIIPASKKAEDSIRGIKPFRKVIKDED